jgi:septal ring factor EnvC (AmiA/AmiB activator)
MARGKAAAQAANRRLAEAQERILALEQQLRDQSAAHKQEATTLKADLQRARGATARDVKRLADERVQDARDEANAATKDAHDTHLSKVVAGVNKLDEIPTVKLEMTLEQWVAVAEAFGVDVGQLMTDVTGRISREVRRTTNAIGREKARVYAAAARGELTPGGKGDVHAPDRWREPQ